MTEIDFCYIPERCEMKRALLIPLFLLLMTLTASAQDPEGVMPLPVLDELIQITDWWVVGPFLGGPREPLANPFAGAYDYETGEVDLSMTFPSEQEYGGEVSWQTTTVDEEGNLVISFDNADWEKINDEWGVSGVYFTAAAYSTFHSTRECRAIVNANGIGSFYINGRQYSGDPYGHGLIQTPVILDAGENTVFFMSGVSPHDSENLAGCVAHHSILAVVSLAECRNGPTSPKVLVVTSYS